MGCCFTDTFFLNANINLANMSEMLTYEETIRKIFKTLKNVTLKKRRTQMLRVPHQHHDNPCLSTPTFDPWNIIKGYF